MNPGVTTTLLPSDQEADRAIIKWYQSAIGSLIWSAVYTRPDIPYSVGVLIRYFANPDPINCNFVTQIFRYLAGSLELGITFRSDVTDELVRYTDSDWVYLKMGGNQLAGMLSFPLEDQYLTNQSNKLLLLFLQPKRSIWLQQMLKKRPCGLLDF